MKQKEKGNELNSAHKNIRKVFRDKRSDAYPSRVHLNTELASRFKIDYCKIEPTSRSKNTG